MHLFNLPLRKTLITSVMLLSASWLSPVANSQAVEFNACNQATCKDGTVTVRAMGMFNISPSGYFTRYTTTNGMNSLCGGALGDGVYYEMKTNTLANPSISQLQKWNYPALTRKGALVTIPKVNAVPIDVAYNPVDKLLYGCFYNSSKTGWELGTLDPENFTSNSTRPTICALERKWDAVAFTPEGILYAIDILGDLYRVATTDGAMTKIGATGLVPSKTGSATIDARTGNMYWCAVTAQGSFICKVDLKTAAAVKIMTLPYGEQLRGLHIYRPDLNDNVPGYAEDFKITFDKASRDGKATFTMPSKLYGGATATGNAKFTIKINNTQVAQSEGAYGSRIEIPVTSPADGILMAEVTVSNDLGDGPGNKTEIRVGAGTPKPVAKVTAEYAYGSGQFNISWTAVTASADGCYIDPEQITYTVTRSNDQTVVAKDIKGLETTDKVSVPADPTTYSYTVTASYGDKTSTATKSNEVRLGILTPPYLNDFSTEKSASEFTIVNANKDVAAWAWTKDRMALPASKTMAMDDWLITPPLSLKEGKAYLLTLDIEGMYINVPEEFEVKTGSQPTPEAMTTPVLPATTVIADAKPTSTLIFPTADGTYYIGIHGTTASGSGALYLNSIEVGEALAVTAPRAVSALKAVPFPDASTKVTVSFTAPSKTISDGTLREITKIEVLRGTTTVKDFTAPAPGASLDFIDDPGKAGDVTYTVVPYNADGKGQSSTISVYAGVNLPAAPKNVDVTETEGTVTVTWQAPGVDAAGFPIDDNLITYDVYSVAAGKKDLLASNLTDLTFTHKACEPGADQQFMQYGVTAKTSRGEGAGSASTLIPVGTPYSLPFNESFSYGSMSHIFGSEVLIGQPNVVEWIQCTSGDINKYVASDDDNGFLAHYAKYVGQSGRLFSGKIKIDAENPVLWFSTFCINESHAGILRIYVNDNRQWKEIRTFTVNQLAENNKGWCRGIVDLSAYKGKTVQIGFAGETHGYAHILLDDVRIFDAKATDMALTRHSIPRIARAATEYNMTVKAENNGSSPVSAHTLTVMLNGKPVATSQGADLKPGKAFTHEISFNIPADIPQTNTLETIISCNGDELTANNTSGELTLNIASGNLPPVQNLLAVSNGSNVEISWDAPAKLSGCPVVTNGFEDATSWKNICEGWTFKDEDNEGISGISGLTLPGIEQNSKQSWWVMDNTLAAISEEIDFTPRSGHKFLAAMSLASKNKTDDWAITPVLTGSSQAIGFWARSFHGRYPESFEVLYSKTGTETKDFTSLATVDKVPYNWTEYTYLLPEGSKYLAVRHNSSQGFMLYLDDFTYTPENSLGEPLQLIGYHIVADGVRQTETPVSATTYTLTSLPKKIMVYPVYSQGLGTGTETSPTSSVEDALDGPRLAIKALAGTIIISGAQGLDISICTPQGIAIYSGTGDATVSVTPGVYIVKAGNTVRKISVR